MAIIKAVKSHGSVKTIIRYVFQQEKTQGKLIDSINCRVDSAAEEMLITKKMHYKTGGVQYYHYIQSFPPGEKITSKEANRMAKELAEKCFPDREVVVATHIDREHTHSHIIVNSVDMENGKKLQFGPVDLRNLKEKNDEMCREHGLSVPVKGREITTYSQDKYKALIKGSEGYYKSYVLDIAVAASAAKEKAVSREDFIQKMEDQGYSVNWKDNRKNITFMNSNGNKVRDRNIEKTFKEPMSKEALEHEFARNQGRETEVDICRDGDVRRIDKIHSEDKTRNKEYQKNKRSQELERADD